MRLQLLKMCSYVHAHTAKKIAVSTGALAITRQLQLTVSPQKFTRKSIRSPQSGRSLKFVMSLCGHKNGTVLIVPLMTAKSAGGRHFSSSTVAFVRA
jgi:hypothetical protein